MGGVEWTRAIKSSLRQRNSLSFWLRGLIVTIEGVRPWAAGSLAGLNNAQDRYEL
jgi:hypothetical protein